MDGFFIIISLQFSYIKSILFGISLPSSNNECCVLKLLPVEISYYYSVSAWLTHLFSISFL